MALDLPTLEIKGLKVKKIKSYSDSTDYSIRFSVTNTSRIPTALDVADRVKIVQKDRVELEFDRKLLDDKELKVKILTPKTRDKTIYFEHLWQNDLREGEFVVRVYGNEPIKGEIKVLSTRGGVVIKEISL